ncbi:MAG: ABC transporter permease [bacterium]|nr:MAG: ABC transporter permease [bacterium]
MNKTLFLKFASISFQKQITYRFDYFVGILNGFLYVFIFTSLWSNIYSQQPQAEHGGFSLTGIITYAVLAMTVRISFSMDDTVIYKKVQDGSVAIDLIRPVSFFFMNLAECAGYSFFHIFARAMPILVISSLMFELAIPVDGFRFFLFTLSGLLGYLILFMMNYMIGLLAFWFIEVFPFQLFKYGLITLFSGGIVPIDFFPETLKPFVMMLPFQYVLYTPTVILMGHADVEQALRLIAGQAAWVFVFAAGCKSAWRAGQRKLVIQGG